MKNIRKILIIIGAVISFMAFSLSAVNFSASAKIKYEDDKHPDEIFGCSIEYPEPEVETQSDEETEEEQEDEQEKGSAKDKNKRR